ncbi:enoyl-CoA hydratase-related protein [Shouchella shacheensis]|uniref:enoyl-CoA hydratase-related protein n=1 Tax=Shouchella shacheensis TaxID=1649580 RepID=UPI0007403238|nr:enoyl-CoA hydratase-related protein [Shouchella shacheensis]
MDYVQYTVEDGVGRIVLDRPDKLNAFVAKMTAEVKKAFKQAEASSDVRCILLTGAGRAFCSGQDLAEVDEGVDHGEMIREQYAPMIKQIRRCEKPVVAGVNGVAAGAGFSLALACDFRIVHESASFVNAFIHVGLVPDSGNLAFLAKMIGEAKALELAILGQKVTAQQAYEYGLATQVVSGEAWERESAAFASKLAAMPTKAIGLIKRQMKQVGAELDVYLNQEAQAQRIAGQTMDHREGVNAFIEKRKPVFTGQ